MPLSQKVRHGNKERDTVNRKGEKSFLYEYGVDELQKIVDSSCGYADVLRKVGLCPKGKNPVTLKKVIAEYGIDLTKMDANRKRKFSELAIALQDRRAVDINEVFSNKRPCKTTTLMKLLVNGGYKEMKCEICGIRDWMGKPIVFNLHHVDGDHYNNNLENLQVLCPNCHSQTDTFSGRNKNKKIMKKERGQALKKDPLIERNELKSLIREKPFSAIGEKYGVTDNAVRKWCIKYNLPYRKKDIRLIDDCAWQLI